MSGLMKKIGLGKKDDQGRRVPWHSPAHPATPRG
jgi:hypothetical protein